MVLFQFKGFWKFPRAYEHIVKKIKKNDDDDDLMMMKKNVVVVVAKLVYDVLIIDFFNEN